MRSLALILTVIVIAGCNRPEEPSTTHGKIFMLVTESHLPLLQQEAAAFMKTYNKADIRMAGTSTREAIVALLNDSVRCICVDRRLNAEERKVADEAHMALAAVRIGRDALVLVINSENPLKSIGLHTVKGIIDGSIKRWNQVPGSRMSGKVEFILTGRNSGVYELLQKEFFKVTDKLAVTKMGSTEHQIVEYMAGDPQALGIVSLAAIVDRPTGIHTLAVESADSATLGQHIEPSQSNIYEELYPLNYSLYLYVSEKRLGLGAGFSTYVMTLQGQQIIQDYGLAPEILPSRIIQLKSE